MENALSLPAVRGAALGCARWCGRLAARPWTLAKAHNLNPWVFVVMAALGHAVEALVFLPWFRGRGWQITFLVTLRLMALVVPGYIWLRGRGIAAAFNVSVAAMYVFNTAWHVCYFVYA